MPSLEDLVDAQFRPYATRSLGLAVEKAAEDFAREMLSTEHFKRLLQATIDRTATALATELMAPAEVALNRAIGTAFEQGRSVAEIARWLRERADHLEPPAP